MLRCKVFFVWLFSFHTSWKWMLFTTKKQLTHKPQLSHKHGDKRSTASSIGALKNRPMFNVAKKEASRQIKKSKRLKDLDKFEPFLLIFQFLVSWILEERMSYFKEISSLTPLSSQRWSWLRPWRNLSKPQRPRSPRHWVGSRASSALTALLFMAKYFQRIASCCSCITWHLIACCAVSSTWILYWFKEKTPSVSFSCIFVI